LTGHGLPVSYEPFKPSDRRCEHGFSRIFRQCPGQIAPTG